MGKKKSVVLMVLLTIVIVALCALTAFPAFTLPWNKVQSWNPAVLQYDLGADLNGGYYAYYYPEGVISETEYKDNEAALQAAVDEAADEDKADKQEELEEYQSSYAKHKGLYISTDEKIDIYSGDAQDPASDEFKAAFEAAANEVSNRFKKKGYSDYRVAVVDDYAMRIELPASEKNVSLSLAYFAYLGDMTIEKGGEVIDIMDGEDGLTVDQVIKSISIDTKYKQAYLKIKFTSEGKEYLASVKDSLSSSSEASSSTDASTLTSVDIKIGDEVLVSMYSDSIMDGDKEARVLVVDEADKDKLETVEILLESAMENGGYDITLATSEVRVFEAVYNANALGNMDNAARDYLFIALTVIIVALLVVPALKMGRFGVVSAYATLSYLIVTGLCFAFITDAVFELTLGGVLVFLAGLVLVNVVQYHIYNAIKADFSLGKTVESSVKGGYRKTLFTIVDIYAVLLLGALALLIGSAGLHTLAVQAIICVITGAFINLLWARGINFTYLSASKDKYKYFRFVREDDDDE